MNDDAEDLAEYVELSQDKAALGVGSPFSPAKMVRIMLSSWNEASKWSLKSDHFDMIKAIVDRVLADFQLAKSRLKLGQRNYEFLQEFRNLRMSTVNSEQQALENGEKAWAATKPVSKDPDIIHNLVLSAKASVTHIRVVIPPWDALSLRMKIEALTAKCEDLLTQAELFVKNDKNQLSRNARRLEAPPANYETQPAHPQHQVTTTAQFLQQQQQQAAYQQPQESTSQHQAYQQAYNGHYMPSSYAGQAPRGALPPPHAEQLSSPSDPNVTHWWQQQQASAASSSAQVNGVSHVQSTHPAQSAVHQVYAPAIDDPIRPIASTSQFAAVMHANGASGLHVQSSHPAVAQQQQQQQLGRQAQQHRQQEDQQRRQEQERQRLEQERQRQQQERQRQEREQRERQEQEQRERHEEERRKLLQKQEEQQQQERHRQLTLQHQMHLAQLVASQKQSSGSAIQPQPQPQVHAPATTSTSQLPPPTQPQLANSQPDSQARQSTYSSLSGALGPPVSQPSATASGSTNGNVNQPPDDVNSRVKPLVPQEKAAVDQQYEVSNPSVSQPSAAPPPDGNAIKGIGDVNVPRVGNLSFQEQAARYQQTYHQRFATFMQKQAQVLQPSVPTVYSAQTSTPLPPVGALSTAPQPRGAAVYRPKSPRSGGLQSNGASQHPTVATQGNAGSTEQNGAIHPPTVQASRPAISSVQQSSTTVGSSANIPAPVPPPNGFPPPMYPYPWMHPMQLPPGHAAHPNFKWVPISQPAYAPNIPLAPGPAAARQQQRPASVTAQAARRSTLARDIFRALEGVAPPEPKATRPAKRKRQPSPPPRRSSSPGSATSEKADIEIVTPAVAISSARAFASSSSRLPLDDRVPNARLTSALLDSMDTTGGATIEELDGYISPSVRDNAVRKKQPLFWSDSSPDETQMQASGLSEDDVDNLLGNAEAPTISSPEGQNDSAAPRTTNARLFPTLSAIASREQVPALPGSSSSAQQLSISAAFRKLRHGWAHPKPDRLIVELPRLPADWRSRKREVDYGQFADFPARFCTRRCEWTSCPAILDSEDRLRLHWDKVHGAGRSDDRDFSCLWDTCDIRSTSLEKLRHHVRCRHIRDCLRCAYEGCDFRASNEADLASHIAAEHGAGRLRPFAVPQQVVPVQIIPELPQGVQPGWRLTTPVVRPAAMSRERRVQLGNWVLMRIYAKVDFELITAKPPTNHRKRKDLAPQMKPLMEGFELEMKEQFEWLRPASSDLPKRIPPDVRIGESVGPNTAAADV